MEEAGEKFEGNLDELKSTYAKKIQRLEDIVKKVNLNQVLNIHIQFYFFQIYTFKFIFI